MPPKIIIFDLGRVLIRICDSWQHACAVAGISAPTGEMDSTRDAALLNLVKLNEVDAIDHQQFCDRVAPLLDLTPSQIARLSDAYLLGPYPGVRELLAQLRSAGHMTACLSNTNTNHWRLMNDVANPNALPLDQLDYRFASQLMRLRKPDDAIYAAVEQETGCRGDEIVFFDDLPHNVAAAQRRGWRAFQIAIDSDPIQQVRTHLRIIGLLAT
ncbi:MAG TPA: HAD-IA family hydrolase [Tepidisphaeraceae bacterium]|jgi:HAD superfamily hydrolase (TIGR01509 family)|nr:HAD-IA family hydrolase [Tepidisphaeraceae bacterium]